MRDLHVVAVSEDGQHVVLATTPDATKGGFRVALDERLAAALRGDLAGLGGSRAGTISVKEIQARLRAGESEQEIARSAGVPLARVERFAGPILSEREQVVQAARRAVLVRGRRGPSSLPLGESVDLRLAELPSVRPESVVWTAFKRDDGRWTVEVSWYSRGHTRTAQWHYDLSGRTVTSVDPASAALGHVDDDEPERSSTSSRAGAAPGRGRPGAARTPAVHDDGEAGGSAAPAGRAATARGRSAARSTGSAAARGSAAPSRRSAGTGTRSTGTEASRPTAARPTAARPTAARPTAARRAPDPAAAPPTARGPRTSAAPDGVVVPAPGAAAGERRTVAGVRAPRSRTSDGPVEQTVAQPAPEQTAAEPAVEPAPAAAPAAAEPTSEPTSEPTAATATAPASDGPSGPPALRVVPPPDEEAPPPPPARRGRASVPGWADVLLSTTPPQEREQD